MVTILLQPLLPWRHQLAGSGTAILQQVQHAPRPAATGTALGIAADHALLIKKTDGLLQNSFGEAQVGMGAREVMHQRRRIAVGLQQALQNPANRQLQTEVLQRRLFEEGPDCLQTGRRRQTAGGHRSKRTGL
ncbi:MAG: hypothetical protein RLZZ611_1513 [Cyanobacteriota bacterium]|jgi:hypothetical protein